MSEWQVQVVRIGKIEKHPNADTLSITEIYGAGGYPVIVRTGDFKEGDLAVYVPADSIVPADDPRWAFLDGHCRIRAKKLRGIFSQGLLTPADPSWKEGRNVAGELRITKHDPEGAREKVHNRPKTAALRKNPLPEYTDIEGLRKHTQIFEEGEEVVITCKLHGSNFRCGHVRDVNAPWWRKFVAKLGVPLPYKFYVGSHHRVREDRDNEWWRVAAERDLEQKMREVFRQGLVLFGEALGCFAKNGYVYDTDGTPGSGFRAFDLYDMESCRYFDYDDFEAAMQTLGVPTVPVLHRGPWSLEKAFELAEGSDPINPKHIREGVVIRPVKERYDRRCGRVILKLKSEAFLLKDR